MDSTIAETKRNLMGPVCAVSLSVQSDAGLSFPNWWMKEACLFVGGVSKFGVVEPGVRR